MNEALRSRILALIVESGLAWDELRLAEETDTPIPEVEACCTSLQEDALLLRTKKGRLIDPRVIGLVPARTAAQRNGTLIAIPLDGGASMKLHQTGKARCLPEDRILVRRERPGFCELYAITRRGLTELAAYLRLESDHTVAPERGLRRPKYRSKKPSRQGITPQVSAVACDRRISVPIDVRGSTLGARNDSIVMLAIDRYPDEIHPMTAHITKVFGDHSDLHARLLAIAETHGFSDTYPVTPEYSPEVLEALPDREDHRSLITFTIDGPFSKDFDDAVSLTPLEDGSVELGVHIADVSHYVRPGTDLDREAYARGTSLYLPGVTIPMLPELLSNDLCSLMPDVDRLTMSAFIRIRDGRIEDSRICRSLIHSHARLTYDQVNRYLDGAEEEVSPEIGKILRQLLEVSHALRSRREANGCIELDLPETDFVLDAENRPVDVFAEPRGEAERMIEDLMLAANEVVAALARHTDTPFVYRIHEYPDPERLHALEELTDALGIHDRLGRKPPAGVLAALLKRTADHPAADTIRKTLLRCMQRARYSELPQGHYALAMEDYCHFTSPIRRYPDLMVHRMLKQLLDGTINETHARMAMISEQCSRREQESTLAEREANDLMKAVYMQDHIGTCADGIITSVRSWGFYVMLENTVEGLVSVASLDDYYTYDADRQTMTGEATGTVFRMGDRVRIRVSEVDIERSEIGFTLLPPKYKRTEKTKRS